MIRVVHPGSRIRMLTFSHPGSRIQGSKRHPIPDPGSGSATLRNRNHNFSKVGTGTVKNSYGSTTLPYQQATRRNAANLNDFA